MRIFCLFVLLILIAMIGIFAVQNHGSITLEFLSHSVTCTLPAFVGIVYLLGMVSGWTVLGILRRSIHRVTAQPRN